MISIIICSRTPNISEELANNIAETIGCKYELVVIDNSKNKYSIFSAYNEGVRRSKGNVLCFMHDDILYRKKNWGSEVEKIFENDGIGCVGVVGGHCFLGDSAKWWNTRMRSGQIIQASDMKYNNYKLFSECNSIEVVAIDGLWMCIPKKMFEQISFDTKNYKGFHCYDADICMQINAIGKQVRVMNNILIEHSSYGTCDDSFYENQKIFLNKWNSFFPILKYPQKMSRNDILQILKEVNDDINHYENDYKQLSSNYESVLNSHAFRLGNFILQPIYFLKRLLKIHR